jgi:phage/plasmid-like protein (TIGR03299 family)
MNSIIMAHQFESGFFVGQGAWHGLGTVLDHPPTTASAIADAGLDWQVNEQAIYTQSVHGLSPVSTHKSLVRSSDYQLLGIVSQQYQPLQNQDAFSWFDFLLHDGDVSLEAAGSLKQGKRIWVLAKVNGLTTDVLRDDAVEPYLLLSNSHDGSTAIWIQFTPIRVVCANTLSYALSRSENDRLSNRAFRIRHQGDIQAKLSQAQLALDFARQRFAVATEEYQAMARYQLNQADFDLYLSCVLDTEDPQSTRAYPKISANFQQGRGNKGQTLWDAYNGVTEWLDYQRGSDANRLDSSWFGASSKTRQLAHSTALALLS